MQVSVNKNTLKIILAISLSFVLLSILSIYAECQRVKDFKTTNGILISIDRSIDYGTSSGDNGHTEVIHTVNYKYYVDETEYKYSYRIFKPMKRFVKDNKTIIYNPDNPNDVRDEFKISTDIAGIIIGFIFTLFTIACLITKHKEDLKHDND